MSNEPLDNLDVELLETAFPAAELVAAREQQGLTQSDVAQELRLSVKYIDSLERGAFDELPSMVFARGYVQSYSKLLKVDVNRYLAMFDRLYGRVGAGNAPQFRSTPGVQSTAKLGDPVIKWSAWIFVLAIVAVTIWWWKTQQGVDSTSSLSPAAESVEVESVDGSTLIVPSGLAPQSEEQNLTQAKIDPLNLAASGDEVNASDASQDAIESADSVVGQLAETVEPVVAVATGAQSEVAPSADGAGDVALRITFTNECWVSVEDHSGKVLAMRVKPAGSELNVSGEAPIKLLLGRVEAVGQVFVNGSPIAFNRESRSGVVRLTLPQSE